MRKNCLVIASLIVLLSVCTGCANKEIFDPGYWYDGSDTNGAPRLVISGQISNSDSVALSGIYVSVFGVRQEKETDINTYNYAVSDSVGKYTMIRYRGREVPAEVTLVVTDSTGIYQEQLRVCEVRYDSVYVAKEGRKIPFNGFVTADFVLSQ